MLNPHKFSLKGKGLKIDSKTEAESIFAPLKDDGEVEEIDLGGNTLGVEACKIIAEALHGKIKLKVANLADIFTGRLREEIPPALTYLVEALLTCPELHTIDLSDNAFGPTAQEPLIHFLANHTPLVHLSLQNNGLGKEAGTKIANALVQLASRKEEKGEVNCLRTLVCGRNRLENDSMAAWACCFSSHKHFERIQMAQNGIRPEGIQQLFREGLVNCTQLKVLDLQDNTFTHTGTLALVEALPRWEQLEELEIGDCLLSTHGGLVLAQALAKGSNTTIRRLSLQYNEINSIGLETLVKGVKHGLPQLTHLALNGNAFSEDDDALDELRLLFTERGFGGLDELDDLAEEESEEEEVEQGSATDDQQEDEETDIIEKLARGISNLAAA